VNLAVAATAVALGITGCSGHKCDAGTVRNCYSGAPETLGVGACRAGEQACVADGSDWGPCEGEVKPAAAESCGTGVDATCDGQVAPACMPVQLVSTRDPEFLAVDADHVYWTSRSAATVSHVGKDGSGAAALYMGEADPRGIDASGARLVWAINSGVRTGAKDGSGGATTLATLSASSYPGCLDLFPLIVVVAGDTTYVTTAQADPCVPVLAIDAMGTVAHAYAVADPIVGDGLAVAGTRLFVTRSLHRVDATNVEQPIVLDADGSAEGLALDEDWVYVKGHASVFKVRQNGTDHTQLATIPRDCGSGYYPVNIAVRGSWVYWLDNCAGEVRRVGKDGTGEHMLAITTDMPFGLVADDHAIYWTETAGASGRVMRLDEP
jgi:hypothetical protein